MKLKEILYDEVYYYTDVFEDVDNIISTIEELDSFNESYPIISQWKKDNSDRFVKHFTSPLSYLNDNFQQVPDGSIKDKMKMVISKMFEGIYRVAEDFYKQKGFDKIPNVMPALHICKYEPGGGIGFHFDAERNSALLYTVAIYWNGGYTGGELGFELANVKRQELVHLPNDQKTIFNIQPEKGSVIIFPATLPYYHASLELKTGIKYFTGSAIYVDDFDPFNREHCKKYTINPDE